MADWTAKQHDRGISVDFTLEDFDGTSGAWVPAPGLDLATAILFIMRSTKGGPAGTGVTVVGAADYVGPGKVSYTFDHDDLLWDGDYDCEIEVTDSPDITRTYPGGDPQVYFSGKVYADLNSGPIG